ncbi:MAG: 2-hydroxyacid dehydrogenase [Candidatus Heimdallarchaeota archaeon]
MDTRPMVLLTHKIPELGLKKLKTTLKVKILDPNQPIEPQLRNFLPAADYLISLLSVHITKDLLASAPRLRGIANYAVGYNNIDMRAAQKYGISVTNTPDVLTNATADLVWGLILAVTRRIVEGDAICRKNAFAGWAPDYLLGYELSGRTLGIIGLGRIGQAVARRGTCFEMNVLYHSRNRNPKVEDGLGVVFQPNLDDLLGGSDVISLHVPYTQETHHLISSRELDIIRPSAFLINTSRGKVVDEIALVRALKENSIAGAGLDVFYDEPRIPEGLRELPNCVLTPHIGSATMKTRNAMAKIVADNILAMVRGEEPPNLVPELKTEE